MARYKRSNDLIHVAVLNTVSGTGLYRIVLGVARTIQTHSEPNKTQSQNKPRIVTLQK